ncbi:MAG: ParB/RepB/Spo0J family partition protein [Alphaproteobacteria bacterium]|nr:ParB/RepB/Spo0J family partition protein [Alphaproteobacteria bacterium]
MAKKPKRGLGRGLDALLGEGAADATPVGDEQVRKIPLDEIEPGRFQPRTEMDEIALQELAASIKAQGVVQPIVVRPLDGGPRFELVAGERRWRASRLAGLSEIPALVRDLPDQTVLAVGLIENIQREGLNPLDEAQALRRLIDECGLTHEQCAEAVGRSRASVTNLLRLVNLDPDVQDMLREGEIEMGHARALLGLPVELQAATAAKIQSRGLNVRQAEALVRSMNAPPAPKVEKPELDDRFALARDRLAEKLKAKVAVKPKDEQRGALVIQYGSAAELEAIFDRLS